MRRLLAILQLLLLALPALSSVMASRARSEASLPACCRRHGAHHCLMTGSERAAILAGVHAQAIPGPCPFSPKVLPSSLHSPSSPEPAATIFAQAVSHPACAAQTLAKRRISQDRSQQKRGPPSIA